LLVVQGLRGQPVLPQWPTPSGWFGVDHGLAWVGAALVAGFTVAGLTRWPVAAVAAFGGVLWVPRYRAGQRNRAGVVARTEAIAGWAEMIRDNIAGAAGLEQALTATAAVAPLPIRAEIARFAARLDQQSLTDALAELGDDLDHPSADLVIAALTNATRMEARELGPLLSRLAESIRADVRMRLRVDVGRARIRTSARIVITVTAGLIGLLYVTARDLLAAYNTFGGQLWLAVVLAVFALGGWVMAHYGRLDLAPERFSARRTPTGQRARPSSW
jgi:Flp pilus assembly protein TadB